MAQAQLIAPSRTTVPPGVAAVLIVLAAAAPLALPHGAAVLAAVGLGTLGLALVGHGVTARWPSAVEAATDAVVLGLLAAARNGGYRVWQVPDAWADVLGLTAPGAAATLLIYGAAAGTLLARTRRHIAPREALAILLLPVLFNAMLLLGSDTLMRRLGFWLTGETAVSDTARAVLGRTVVLFGFTEALAAVLRWLVSGRFGRDWRLHGLLLGSAVHAVLTPVLADLPASAAGWGTVGQDVVAVVAAALAQSGLWATVFIVTGLALDALGKVPPTFATADRHWRGGLVKGAIYGGLFMALLLAGGLLLTTPILPALLRAMPVPMGMALGAALFPLAATVVASADGTPPFFGRLREAYAEPRAYVRGAAAGGGIALALQAGLPGADGLVRFLAMFATGALSYGGVDLACDAVAVARGWRSVVEPWRVYALGLLLGGLVGGALGWYFDAAQVAVVTQKFWAYVALDHGPDGTFAVNPLFNKWGTVDLGHAGNGVRLFYDESLSGVINWAIAAPLFSINYFVLAALFSRSLTPLKQLVSPAGFKSLVEQAVRVLRWGLWMAPVINSFLRQSPDPSWYNQDGAVRTVAATAASAVLPADTFRHWSLTAFTGLLAYDWLRVLIWFDHMGLRVATLVNLTFIGGDRADEAAARFAGHAARTRIIPTGIRRFATWAPLLIPFYIPHGPDWDMAWTGAERIRATAPPLETSVDSLIAIYAVAGAAALLGIVVIARRWDGRRGVPRPDSATAPAPVAQALGRFALANGFVTAELMADGRGHLSVDGTTRGGHPADVTRRVADPMQVRGPFFFLRDRDGGGLWSLGYEPLRQVGDDYAARQSDPAGARLRNTVAGLTAEAEVRLAEDAPVEVWRIRLTNTGDRPRRVTLTSYRELAAHDPNAYARDPDFNALHVETVFVGALQGLLTRNRLLRGVGTGRMSSELFFHAVRMPEGARLSGYEDSRSRFLGQGGIRDPAGLRPGAPRAVDDEGSLYTFDPAASLGVDLDIAAGGTAEVLFATGWGRDEKEAVDRMASHAGVGRPAADAVAAVWRRTRALDPRPPQPASSWPFGFTPEGDELGLTERTPRPWAHVLANANGFGAVVSNEGEIHSFNANARQNALTPFRFDSVPTANPGQLVYVVDLDTGEADTPGFIPFRRADARHRVTYGLGVATFTKMRGDTELSLSVFVLPDGPADLRVLTIRNRGTASRRFRVVPYFEMALDESAEDSAGRLVSARDETTEALLFTNPRNDFHRGWAFAGTSLTNPATETVRTRFFGGAGRDHADPFMVEHGIADASREDDGRRVAAFAGIVEVPPEGEAEVVVVLGQAASRAEAITMAATWRDLASARAALKATRAWWSERLNDIRVETNDPAFDRLVNHWLPYQALAARLWGRNGPNQRGGATGFRDQLQDVLPFLFSDASLARRQIVLHAGVQFPEGDVFKWWHAAPDGRTGLGQRTRASDPHLWLPYVLTRYVEATGDLSVLDERAAYLEGPAVPEGAIDLLVAPRASREVGDVYDHCRRAIDYTLARRGRHGLPLIGTGDWNDGVDAAGGKGRGEGVWLAFFLHDILRRFAPLARLREGDAAAARLDTEAQALRRAIAEAWTGDHFAFVYNDDGERLDPASIMTAAWPALSGAVDPDRARAALEHGLRVLDKGDRVLLLSPAFDEHSQPYPGRIADYPPGVRENGGQYSHGASWTVDAYVALADAAREAGDERLAADLLARAFAVWRAVSPLGKTEGDALGIYGLAPHQQPADIYDGPGYAGRGGWSWYTGSAARMLSAAYALIGLRMAEGRVIVPDTLFEPRGDLQLRSLTIGGKHYTPPSVEPVPAAAQ